MIPGLSGGPISSRQNHFVEELLRLCGVQLPQLFVNLPGLAPVASSNIRNPKEVPRLRIVRHEPDGLAKRLNGLRVLARAAVCNPKVVPRRRKIRLDADGLAVGLDRLGRLAGLAVSNPKAVPRPRKAENELALSYAGYGRFLRHQGWIPEAREYLTQGLGILDRLGTLIKPDKVRQELPDLPPG